MKKKFKLLTSIASLGLAIALMAFGVVAALNVNVTVDSKVSYSVGKNVIMSFAGASEAQTAGEPKAIASLGEAISTNGTESNPHATTYEVQDLSLSVGQMAVYTFKVDNLNKNAALAVSITVTADDYTVGGITAGAQANIAAEGTATYTITLTPKDTTADITPEEDNVSIVFAFEAQ